MEVAVVDAATFAAVAGAAMLLRARRDPRATAALPGDSGRARDGWRSWRADPAVVTLAASGRGAAALLQSHRRPRSSSSRTCSMPATPPTGCCRLLDARHGRPAPSGSPGAVPRGGARRAALAGVAVQGAGIASAAAAGVLLGRVRRLRRGRRGPRRQERRLRRSSTASPEALRGRAFAAYNAARNAAELGALGAAGVLVGAIGAQPALLLAGVAPLALGAGRPAARRPSNHPHHHRRTPHAYLEG